MLAPYSRPSFFPGQLLDYRDFNRLAEQANQSVSTLSAQLFPGGGILLQALREFELETTGLTVVIKPGMAILPNGEMLILNQDLALDLRTYIGSKPQTVIVGLNHKRIGQDVYVDEEDPSIKGFRSEGNVCEVVVATEDLSKESIELFRVVLTAQCTDLIPISQAQAWSPDVLLPIDGQAILDCRFRKSIVPLTFAPFSFFELLKLRNALYSMEESHRRIQKIFFMEDRFGSWSFLSQLHAEMLCVPYQPLKVAFLITEYAQRLALFLESVERKCTADQPNFDREIYLGLCKLLAQVRVRHALPRALPFDLLMKTAQEMDNLARVAEQRFTLLNAVEESLIELRDRSIGFPDQMTFAGHIFDKVDYLTSTDSSRVQCQAQHSQIRKLQARYASGDCATRVGVFLREGKVSFDFRIAKTDAPVVIWFPQYIRRKGAKIEYRINGKTLHTESSTESTEDNQWRNKGLILHPEMLVPQGNRLSLRIEEADLDYGFFEAAVYQPASGTVGGCS